ncbi:MAG: pyridoxamine 5'-phosphate oxidase family protein [Mycobacterium leprae]
MAREVKQAETVLSDELVAFLQGPRLVLVTTMDAETGWPTNNLITWVLAVDNHTLRLASDAGGRIMANIKADQKILLTCMAYGACHCISGVGRPASDALPEVQPKMACVEVSVRTVRDVTFWGGRITAEPQYDVNYDQALKEKMDNAVFTAMRGLGT